MGGRGTSLEQIARNSSLISLTGSTTADAMLSVAARQTINFAGGVVVSTTIGGQSFNEAMRSSALSAASGFVGEVGATHIGRLYYGGYINPATQYALHAALGCATGAIQGDCAAGAIGAVAGELVGSQLRSPLGQPNPYDITLGTASARLAGTIAAALAGRDATIGGMTGENAARNNAELRKSVLDMARRTLTGLSPRDQVAVVYALLHVGEEYAPQNPEYETAKALRDRGHSPELASALAQMQAFGGSLELLQQSLFSVTDRMYTLQGQRVGVTPIDKVAEMLWLREQARDLSGQVDDLLQHSKARQFSYTTEDASVDWQRRNAEFVFNRTIAIGIDAEATPSAGARLSVARYFNVWTGDYGSMITVSSTYGWAGGFSPNISQQPGEPELLSGWGHSATISTPWGGANGFAPLQLGVGYENFLRQNTIIPTGWGISAPGRFGASYGIGYTIMSPDPLTPMWVQQRNQIQ